MAPFGFFVDSILGYRSQSTNCAAISADRSARHMSAGRLIHERHEFVREAGHGTANTNAADVGPPANSRHPPAFRNVAVDHRTPASQLHNAFRGAVRFGEVALLVVAGSVATFVDRLAEKPSGPQLIIERNHRRECG